MIRGLYYSHSPCLCLSQCLSVSVFVFRRVCLSVCLSLSEFCVTIWLYWFEGIILLLFLSLSKNDYRHCSAYPGSLNATRWRPIPEIPPCTDEKTQYIFSSRSLKVRWSRQKPDSHRGRAPTSFKSTSLLMFVAVLLKQAPAFPKQQHEIDCAFCPNAGGGRQLELWIEMDWAAAAAVRGLSLDCRCRVSLCSPPPGSTCSGPL